MNNVYLEMEAGIAADLLLYPVIRGMGGFRKARWRRSGGGKSGAVRTIFYFFVSGDTIFFTLLHANELENLNHDQEKELKRLAQAIESRE